MSGQGRSIIGVFDFVWERLTARVAGLEDDEYYWEPVSGCWTLREDESGRLVLDGAGGGGPPPDPVPLTTIAWRIGHICDLVLAGFAARIKKLPDSELPRQPGNAADLPDYMDASYKLLRDWLVSVPEDSWPLELGPDWGPYAEASWLDLALHVLDELAHHGAEVGLLRDLYAQRGSLAERSNAGDGR